MKEMLNVCKLHLKWNRTGQWHRFIIPITENFLFYHNLVNKSSKDKTVIWFLWTLNAFKRLENSPAAAWRAEVNLPVELWTEADFTSFCFKQYVLDFRHEGTKEGFLYRIQQPPIMPAATSTVAREF